jgi:diacylglycerol kinase
MMIVLAAELLNTALEATLDRVSVEHHPLAKVAKDTAAGAVFISAGGAVLIGLLILGPHLLTILGWR